MKKIFLLIININFLLAVPCDEYIRYYGQGDDDYKLQEIKLTCNDGYRFRVLSELPRQRILEIEDNKYLNKGKMDENKKN